MYDAQQCRHWPNSAWPDAALYCQLQIYCQFDSFLTAFNTGLEIFCLFSKRFSCEAQQTWRNDSHAGFHRTASEGLPPRKIQGQEVHMHPFIDETTCEMHRLNTRYRLKCPEMRVNSVTEVRIYQHGHRIDMCCWYCSATFVYVDSTQSNNHLTAVTSACKDGPFRTKYASNLVTNIRDATHLIENWCITFGHCVLHKLQVASRPHSSA